MLPVTADLNIITSSVLIWHVSGSCLEWFLDILALPHMRALHVYGFRRSPGLSGMKLSIAPHK